MKILKTVDGKKIRRVSRWIKVRQNCNASRRNRLWYYAADGNGRREGQEGYDPGSGLCLSYFVWGGRAWAIEQFMAFGTPMVPQTIMWVEDGKPHFMAGFDSENYFNPIMIEVGDDGESVRVYEEV